MHCYRALGVTVGLRVDDEQLEEAVRGLLAPMRTDGPPSLTIECSRGVARWADDALVLGERPAVRTMRLLQLVNRLLIETTPRCAMHAAAVAIDGRAIVMPAERNDGKTTLTAALVMAGYDYLTDEAASTGWHDSVVGTYHKPLALSPASLEALGLPVDDTEPHLDSHLTATQLRPASLGKPAPLGSVIFPRYGQGREPSIEPMTRGEMLVEMARQTFGYAANAQAIVEHYEAITRGVIGYRLTTGDLDRTVQLVAAAVEAA